LVFLTAHTFDGEWAGKPFALSDWQEWDIIRPLFGWKRKIDGTRRFRDAYIEIARGNGKSMLAGGIALYLMIADGEFGAQVYAAATKEEQAKIVWGAAKRMVELSPLLREEVKAYHKSLSNSYLGSVFRPLGKDSKTQDGLSVHGGIIDEYHAHKDSNMRDVLASGTVKRKQPLLTIITTAGIDTECPCKRESDYGKRILQNVVQNDRYFTFIATVDDPEKWHDEAEWYKANPNLGISVYLEEIRSQFTKAKQVPSLETGFKVKNLNIWSESSKKWISPSDYAKGNGAIDWSTYRGRRTFGGLDLGISRDLSAFALLFQGEEKENGDPADIFAKMKYWLPEESLQKRSETDGVPYQQWVDEGWIQLTPGRTTRYDLIRKYINECSEEYEIFEAAMDQAHAHQLMVELADDGLNIVKHAQSMKAMTVPCRNFEEIIMQGRFKHGDDPVLRWMVDNCSNHSKCRW
jgi:phage terminase large subunit-like protein